MNGEARCGEQGLGIEAGAPLFRWRGRGRLDRDRRHGAGNTIVSSTRQRSATSAPGVSALRRARKLDQEAVGRRRGFEEEVGLRPEIDDVEELRADVVEFRIWPLAEQDRLRADADHDVRVERKACGGRDPPVRRLDRNGASIAATTRPAMRVDCPTNSMT